MSGPSICTLVEMGAPVELHPTQSTALNTYPTPPRPSRSDPEVPRSLALRDLHRIGRSFFGAMGAAAMTAMTVGAGMTATALVAGLTLSLLRDAPGVSSPQIFEALLLCIASGGAAAMLATLFVGLLHFVLPRLAQSFFLIVRAPWFIPSTVLCAPLASLWRLGLWGRQPWEADLAASGLRPKGSMRLRRYSGVFQGLPVELRQDILGGALEFRCRIPDHLPAAYVGPQKIAGTVGVFRALVRCPALTDSELLLRDGLLVVRRRWVRPNVSQLVTLVGQMVKDDAQGGLLAEMQTLSLLAEWRQLSGSEDERRHLPWPSSPAIARYLETLKRALRVCPPNVDILASILSDSSVRAPAKAWLMSVVVLRLSAEEATALADTDPKTSADPITALADSPNWPAWVAVQRLSTEGGPDALAALHALTANPQTPPSLHRMARRAGVRIIERHGGVHTLTGHLSMIDSDDGQLTLIEPGTLALK